MTSIPEQDSYQIVARLMFNGNKLTDVEKDALKIVYQGAVDAYNLLDAYSILLGECARLQQTLINYGLAEEIE